MCCFEMYDRLTLSCERVSFCFFADNFWKETREFLTDFISSKMKTNQQLFRHAICR